MLLHPGHPPAPHDLWHAWSLEPAVLLGLAATTWLYARGVRALWRRAGRGRGVPPRNVACFAGGLFALFVALVSPLDRLGTALFSAHMVQHLTLVLVAAPLLALGVPTLAFLWSLPPAARRTAGAWWRRARWLRRFARALVRPVVAWTLHTAALWIWHLPSLYQGALQSDAIHAVEHATFIGTALLFWWPLTRPDRRRRLGFGADLLYLFTAAMQSGVLGALITFAKTPWYPLHAGPAWTWGLTALQDQQLAGLIMWIPASVVYLGAAAAAFLTGMARLDRSAALLARPVGVLLLCLILGACSPTTAQPVTIVTGGDAERGRAALKGFGCGACHTIPGVPTATGMVGPPLTAFARRAYIAGQLPNEPDNLIRWIQNPQQVEPGTAMPNLGVTPSVARDIAAYLYTLR